MSATPLEPQQEQQERARRRIIFITEGKADPRPIVVVLTEQVSDAHLAGLHRDGVSYIFAGEGEVDLGLALDIPNRELGTKRLRSKAAAMRTGPSLRRPRRRDKPRDFLGCGRHQRRPCVFDSSDDEAGATAPVRAVKLESSEVLEGGVVWLRYLLQSA